MLGVALLRANRATHLTRRFDRESAHMSDVVARDEWQTKKVRDWLLAILRFGVTLRDEDRLLAGSDIQSGLPAPVNVFDTSKRLFHNLSLSEFTSSQDHW